MFCDLGDSATYCWREFISRDRSWRRAKGDEGGGGARAEGLLSEAFIQLGARSLCGAESRKISGRKYTRGDDKLLLNRVRKLGVRAVAA